MSLTLWQLIDFKKEIIKKHEITMFTPTRSLCDHGSQIPDQHSPDSTHDAVVFFDFCGRKDDSHKTRRHLWLPKAN
ncbi:MAG TPA: hypothetical protein DCE42_29645 [Myxococcales bacterium]|nr:hypothetical protein [Deltaproteobacteria bacterium]MBU47663.1 hypothetical protein [Deltaproteobacteria bacterium]HAA58958.1 hypothetical protein [Myxococcales bacterium]